MFASKLNLQIGEVAKSATERFRGKIIALRKERGWSQEVAAEKCSLGYKSFQHLEIGIRDNPTLRTIEKLAKGFGVEIRELFEP